MTRRNTLAVLVIALLVVGLLAEAVFILDAGGVTRRLATALQRTETAPMMPADWESAGSPAAAEQIAPYRVYFTTPGTTVRRGEGLDERLVMLLSAATSSVDMAIYQLDLPDVTQALLAAHDRGVRVRLVTDSDTLAGTTENASFAQLMAAGIVVVGGNSDAIMHDKFVVVDGAFVWTGSWNFTSADTVRYNNNALLIRSKDLASNYTAAFEKMFSQRRFGSAKTPGGVTARLDVNSIAVESYFSPEDKPADRIMARLRQAQQSIYFMAFSFTHDGIGQAVRGAAQAGLVVQGVFEASGGQSEFSEYAQMHAMGMDVVLDGNPYLMHHKVFIIDEQTVVMGSLNFSDVANRENDENVLIIDDARLAQAYLAEFRTVYKQAQSARR